jgi:hypothetical protein
MNYLEYWNSIKEKKKNEPLVFIHTPKCAGTYATQILKDFKIKNKEHSLALKNEGITFTIIRDPVDRFESLLNYRLNENLPRNDWPMQLAYVYHNKNITLNEIVFQMTDNDILGFSPYKSLTYWSQNVDILITINKLHEFLNFFGYNYNIEDYEKKNVSNKLRGAFDEETKFRIKKLYNDDVILFNKIINSNI